jgi:hypothetical protein
MKGLGASSAGQAFRQSRSEHVLLDTEHVSHWETASSRVHAGTWLSQLVDQPSTQVTWLLFWTNGIILPKVSIGSGNRARGQREPQCSRCQILVCTNHADRRR